MDKRYLHKNTSYHKTTMDLGLIYPLDFIDVTMGQTTYLKYDALFRFQPLLAPTMTEINAHIVSFFVPYRLLWEDFLIFLSGTDSSISTLPLTKIVLNSFTSLGSTMFAGTLLDYFGFPIRIADYPANINWNFNFFPFLAYHKIWNEHFRNPDIQQELDLEQLYQDFLTGLNNSNFTAKRNALYGLRRCNWGKDRFTKALLETQADPSIQLPVGANGVMQFEPVNQSGEKYNFQFGSAITNNWVYGELGRSIDQKVPANQFAKYAGGLSGVDMSDFKLATAIWNWHMNLNKYGRTLDDYFKKYGIRNMDNRLSRSECIGGFAQTMQISDVIATDGSDLGKQGGHAVGYSRARGIKHFAPEPGCILTMCYLKPKADYVGGINRFFLKRDMLDFPQKEFWNIGYQPIYKDEIGANEAPSSSNIPASEDDMQIFGYELRYSEYRSVPNSVTGEIRPEGTLSHWANPRNFVTAPNLNGTFLECNPSNQMWASPDTDKAIVMLKRKMRRKMFLPKISDPSIKI